MFSAGSCQMTATVSPWRATALDARPSRAAAAATGSPRESTKPSSPSTRNTTSTDGSSSASATISRNRDALGSSPICPISRLRAPPAKKLAWTIASRNPSGIATRLAVTNHPAVDSESASRWSTPAAKPWKASSMTVRTSAGT